MNAASPTILMKAAFFMLGSNYLLPFNTLINLYDYYLNEKELPISTPHYMTLLNVIFQLTANAINASVLFIDSSLHGKEICALNILTLVVVACLACLAMAAFTKINGIVYIIVSLVAGGMISICQSVCDTLVLLFTDILGKQTVLAYTAGINLSGTLHALVYIGLQLSTFNNYKLIAGCYFTTTALAISLSLLVYYSCFKSINNLDRLDEIFEEEPANLRHSYKKVRVYFFLLLVNFTITLFIFPNMCLRTPNSLPSFDLFNAVFVFFLFNFSALLGNIMAWKSPLVNLKTLFILQIARLILCVPFFLAYQKSPQIFTGSVSTLVFCVFIIYTGSSSAFSSSCAFYAAFTPTGLTNKERIACLRLLNLGVSLGLIMGSVFSHFIFYII